VRASAPKAVYALLEITMIIIEINIVAPQNAMLNILEEDTHVM
jgi:hypothetical protein